VVRVLNETTSIKGQERTTNRKAATMKLTYQTLHSAGSYGGKGFNAKQLALLGVEWPPQKGWLLRLVGSEVPDSIWEQVIALKGKTKPKVKWSMKARVGHAVQINSTELLLEERYKLILKLRSIEAMIAQIDSALSARAIMREFEWRGSGLRLKPGDDSLIQILKASDFPESWICAIRSYKSQIIECLKFDREMSVKQPNQERNE
jgi:hypothetical protein